MIHQSSYNNFLLLITCFVVVDNKVLNTSIIVEQDIFIS